MEIRKLEVRDLFTVARMLSKVAGGVRSQLAEAMGEKKGKKKVNPMELGMAMFSTLFVESEQDMKEWLASLIGKEVEEFNVMPAVVVLDLIEGLAQQDDIRDFFMRASSLSANLSKSLKPST